MPIKATKVRFTGAGKGKIRARKSSTSTKENYAAALKNGSIRDGGKVKRDYGTIPD